MNILVLRIDVFEELHEELYSLWKDIIHSYMNNNVKEFTESFLLGHDISYKMLPEMYVILESYPYLRNELNALKGEQGEILMELKYIPGKSISKADAKAQILSFLSCISVSEGFALRRNEYYELEESKKILLHDIEKLESIIKKEMKKFWDRIDTLIIESYKQMLYDVTGSDDLVQSSMNESRTSGITKHLAIAKRRHDYDDVLYITGSLSESINNWIRELEQIVGGTR